MICHYLNQHYLVFFVKLSLLIIYTLLLSNLALVPVPNNFNAPFSLEALALLNIQFCQADNLPNILVSQVSLPTNLKLASKPVKVSGEKDALSSI